MIRSNISTCRSSIGFYPNVNPIIYNMSIYTAVADIYTTVYINGLNFLPYGTTFVNFGSFKNIPITYFSSNNISFNIPLEASIGSYDVQVVSIYSNIINSHFVYSNKVIFTLT